MTKGVHYDKKENLVSWWKSEKIYNCSTKDMAIQRIPPLAAAVKYGCLCRGLKNDLQLTETFKPKRGTIFSCRKTTIQSPGHLVWAMSDGTWTTHLPLDGKVKQITLGMPTLCPIWKKSPFKGSLENLKLERAKKSEIDDEWNEPSTGVRISWALKSLLTPLAIYRNRDWLYQLTGQVEKLANVTRKGFRDLNIQLQATSKMTLQNRMALDMLLLKEHGVCGYLKDRLDHCCIHILNVTQDVEHDLELLGKIEKDTQELLQDMQESWIDKIFKGLGWNLSSWIKSLISTVLTLLIIFLMIILIYYFLKKQITRKTSFNRMIIQAVARQQNGQSIPEFPPAYSE
ncbi:uncharacterized protein LOC121232958 [Aquila chrysaetos chrysaetos]|uniref:uncharacterized protein LOC121232958 n=1 Tax=Aquila chrysaetos chrysaetos TaxID=223781 RepID=UPI001B7D357B|nr:uncharacterized protein LOC121232958 [Aquila chrysaetos chrysaetos]